MSNPMTTTPPALTAEEWADIASDPEWWEERARDAGHDTGGWLNNDTITNRRHAGAAIALYGQPFGFTHDGLRALRLMMEYAEEHFAEFPLGEWSGARHEFDKATGEVAKIAALLPPEPV